jgi:hypothetical protein
MYIRIKIYNKKEMSQFNKPIYASEFDGTHAIEIMIEHVIKYFFGKTINDKVEQKLNEIKYILYNQG